MRKYVERFNDEIAKIEELNQGVACSAMLQGTSNEDFRKELLAKAPRSIEALMTLANTAMRVDDGQYFFKKMKEYKRELSPRGDRRSPKRNKGTGGSSGPRSYNLPRYTLLNASRERVLMHIRDNGERIDWPKRMSSYTAERRDNGQYCHFHKDIGHDTEQCNHLKKEIEKLIQAGSLR